MKQDKFKILEQSVSHNKELFNGQRSKLNEIKEERDEKIKAFNFKDQKQM